MTTRVLKLKSDLTDLLNLLKAMKLPCTVTITKGKKRSDLQNRLQRLWHNEAADQLADESAEDKRAFCKLHFGVPILRNENEEFRKQYDSIVRPLPYEKKLELMKVPIDFPVTRLMTTGQHKRFLDDIYQHYLSHGVKLTNPEALEE